MLVLSEELPPAAVLKLPPREAIVSVARGACVVVEEEDVVLIRGGLVAQRTPRREATRLALAGFQAVALITLKKRSTALEEMSCMVSMLVLAAALTARKEPT